MAANLMVCPTRTEETEKEREERSQEKGRRPRPCLGWRDGEGRKGGMRRRWEVDKLGAAPRLSHLSSPLTSQQPLPR